MNGYSHYISGFFAKREDAQHTLSTLLARGFPHAQLQIFEVDEPPSEPVPQEDSNAVLKDVIVDAAKGSAVGLGLGALAEVALVAANVTLFVTSPLVAPLALLGWGVGLGGVIGGAIGIQAHATAPENKEGWLSDLVRDAIASGQTVLMVQALTAQETATAKEVIQAAVGDYKDVSRA
jgi:anti-sigma factor RsiW